MSFIKNLVANSSTISKFLVAIVSDVIVNIHNGWTSPTGIITDTMSALVYFVPNAKASAAIQQVIPDVQAIAAAVVGLLRTPQPAPQPAPAPASPALPASTP